MRITFIISLLDNNDNNILNNNNNILNNNNNNNNNSNNHNNNNIELTLCPFFSINLHVDLQVTMLSSMIYVLIFK